MKRLVLIAFLFSLPSAWAGESVIVGEGKAGLFYEFSFYFGNTEEAEEAKPKVSEALALIVWRYQPVPNKRNTVTRKNLGSEYLGVCKFTQQKTTESVVCNSNAPHGLANVIYTNKKKNSVFRCAKNCTTAIPPNLKFEDVPNGC